MNSLIKGLLVLLMAIISAGCLASCAPLNENNTFIDTVPDNYTSFRQSDASSGVFLDISIGYYFLMNRYIYYLDAETFTYILLCNKPNCEHDTKDCNAFVGSASIGVYKDQIYFVRSDEEHTGYYLYRMNLDGTGHEKVKKLSEISQGHIGYFDKGYLYFLKYTPGLIVSNSEQTRNIEDGLFRTAVFDNSEPEKLNTSKYLTGFRNIFYNNKLFCLNTSGDKIVLYCYSVEDNEWSLLSEDWGPYGSYFADDKAYCYRSGDGFYEYDYSTRTMTCVLKTEADGKNKAYYLNNYICLIKMPNGPGAPSIYYFYDWKYNLIDSVEVDIPVPDYSLCTFYADTEKYILISTENILALPDYYIDKSEIGKGNITVHKIGE